MACGAVRVNELETVESDNPRVDPQVVAKPLSLDADARAWVAELPRRTANGGFLRASVRAATQASLALVEAEADARPGSLGERLRAAGVPGRPPPATRGLDPFRRVYAALALGPSSPLVGALLLAEGGSLAGELARDWLATRGNVLGEVAATLHGLRPANVTIAVAAALTTATAEERAALVAAVRRKLDATDPHSSDVAELRRVLDRLV